MRARIEARLRALQVGPLPVQSMQVEGGALPSAELQARLAGPHRRAAVLIGLIDRAPEMTVLLTRRATHLARHAGQVAFPGGRIDPGDADATAAALREAAEEIGLGNDSVEVAGRLGDHITGTGFIVTPIVGFITPQFEPQPDPAEVAAVFEVPLARVLDPASLRATTHERYGTRLRGFELIHEGERIWGATAAMLATFRSEIYLNE